MRRRRGPQGLDPGQEEVHEGLPQGQERPGDEEERLQLVGQELVLRMNGQDGEAVEKEAEEDGGLPSLPKGPPMPALPPDLCSHPSS